MPSHIQIEFALRNLIQIDLRGQNALFPVNRSRKNRAQRIHDNAAATNQNISPRCIEVRRIVRTHTQLACGNHCAPTVDDREV
jgi:hypothetical protein